MVDFAARFGDIGVLRYEQETKNSRFRPRKWFRPYQEQEIQNAYGGRIETAGRRHLDDRRSEALEARASEGPEAARARGNSSFERATAKVTPIAAHGPAVSPGFEPRMSFLECRSKSVGNP